MERVRGDRDGTGACVCVREIVEERFDQTLDVYLSILIGELAQIGDQRFSEIMPDLQEPRFELPLSGWYWMVFEAGSGEVLQTSESLAGDLIETPTDELASLEPWALYRTYVEGPAGEPLRLVVRRIAFEDGRWFLVAVSGAADTIEADTTRFARQHCSLLVIFSASLIAATYVQWRISPATLDPARHRARGDPRRQGAPCQRALPQRDRARRRCPQHADAIPMTPPWSAHGDTWGTLPMR